ncbi:hypothetical protein JW968_00755 [Candidatus Woesearchaeota archaeon]|nr:hypothetical protein [Candidatus Woesearchaeota archaeon]
MIGFLRFPRLPKADRLYVRTAFLVTTIIRMILVVAVVSSVWQREWFTLFLSFSTFVLTFLPALIKRNYYITLPIELELVVIIFLFSSIFLGEVHGYYTKFWWWDLVLHCSSAIVLAFLGFMIVYSLYISRKIILDPFFVALFSFSFALSIGALWEIVEFTVDSTLGFNMQKSGLVDTMWDLIIDACGALVVSTAGYFYVKSGHLKGFNLLLEKFAKVNPKLFNKG